MYADFDLHKRSTNQPMYVFRKRIGGMLITHRGRCCCGSQEISSGGQDKGSTAKDLPVMSNDVNDLAEGC